MSPHREQRDVVLALAELGRRYPRTAAPALDGVDLEVRRGEVVALIGESGCGKTTLLRLVAGLDVPDAGTVLLDGREVAGGAWVPPERRGVGMVFQDFALFPHLRARDNVAFGLNSLAAGRRRERADELLAMVGLAGLGDRFPHQLSGGQQQRVALARALAPSPHLLLLDEPFSNLDAALKGELREELGEVLRRTNTTALLVVHDADDVLALADRVGVMRHGRLLQMGVPAELYRRPVDEYVARCFGEVNVLTGKAAGAGFDTPLGFIPCAAAVADGVPVRLCLRPEHLQICGGDTVGREALVRNVRPRGLHRRILVTLQNGEGPAESLTLYAGAEPPLTPGDRVFVRPRPECVHVLGDAAGERHRKAGAV